MARQDDAKDPRELEREVEQQRSSIEQTLAELIERFSPQQLLQQFLGGESSSQPRQILELLKANPIPTLMAAAGVGWLMMSQSRNPEAHANSHADSPEPWDEPSHASYGVDPDYDPRSGAGHVALEKTEVENVGNASGSFGESKTYEDDLGSNVNSLVRNQPLLIAAFGLAIGGVLAATLPRSSREDAGFDSDPPLSGRAGERRRDRENPLGEAEPSPDIPTRH